jgi:hypothetical protein
VNNGAAGAKTKIGTRNEGGADETAFTTVATAGKSGSLLA